MASPPPATPPAPGSCETTVIAAGTTLVGDVSTAGGIRVNGSVKGNLKIASTMELSGKIIGDIECVDATVSGSMVRGNVAVTNVLTIDSDTTIVGDVSAKNVDINGKIKGNLMVEERSHFQADAILVGNLISGTVIIDEGAMLKGDISITNQRTEIITVEEPEFEI
jgi:cytoskeletal protein CcmA (bactofilin family)